MSLFPDHQNLLDESHSALCNTHTNIVPLWRHKAAEINGETASDSDITDNKIYVDIKDIGSEQAHSLISKQRKTIRRRVWYIKAEIIAEKSFLGRKHSTVRRLEE